MQPRLSFKLKILLPQASKCWGHNTPTLLEAIFKFIRCWFSEVRPLRILRARGVKRVGSLSCHLWFGQKRTKPEPTNLLSFCDVFHSLSAQQQDPQWYHDYGIPSLQEHGLNTPTNVHSHKPPIRPGNREQLKLLNLCIPKTRVVRSCHKVLQIGESTCKIFIPRIAREQKNR